MPERKKSAQRMDFLFTENREKPGTNACSVNNKSEAAGITV
jgi:hypothetical protein